MDLIYVLVTVIIIGLGILGIIWIIIFFIQSKHKLTLYNGDRVEFIYTGKELPKAKGEKFNGTITRFYEKNRVKFLICFWPNGIDESGFFISFKDAKNIKLINKENEHSRS